MSRVLSFELSRAEKEIALELFNLVEKSEIIPKNHFTKPTIAFVNGRRYINFKLNVPQENYFRWEYQGGSSLGIRYCPGKELDLEDGGEITRARAFGKGDLINELYSQVKKWIDKWKLINDINSKFDLYFGDIPNVNFEDEDIDLEETEVNVLINNLIAFRNLSLESKFDDEIKKKIDEVVTRQVKELKENPTLKTKKLTLLQILEIFHLIYSLGKDFYELAGILWMMTFKVIGVNQQMLAFLSLKP